MLQITPIPAFKDNYIWLLRDAIQADCVVSDPGDAQPVLDYLMRNQLRLAAILVTHHHADHCGGVSKLLEHARVPVYGPAHESIATITQPVQTGAEIQLPELKLTLQVFDIPGHTAGHVAYYGQGVLFCGDTLFLAGCGRLFEGTAQQMVQSLSLLANLPNETLVYCGHEYTLNNLIFARVVEPDNAMITERIQLVQSLRNENKPTVPATLQIEKTTNPFLRCHLATVKQAAEKFIGKSLHTPVEVFQVIRQWKDNFR